MVSHRQQRIFEATRSLDCGPILAQITINKGQGVLAQITANNFFYKRTRTKFWCGLAQIKINKEKTVLAQITRNNFFYEKTRTKMWFVLAQITINKGKYVLAQITRNNFFYERTRKKSKVCAGTNHNKQRTMCVSTNNNKQFFSMKGVGQKIGLCCHKSQTAFAYCSPNIGISNCNRLYLFLT
jgi:hypothetical protein